MVVMGSASLGVIVMCGGVAVQARREKFGSIARATRGVYMEWGRHMSCTKEHDNASSTTAKTKGARFKTNERRIN